MKKISFVIPCYRSERTIGKVIDEITAVICSMEQYEYEIIAVDDCSPDGVYEVLKQRAQLDMRIKVLSMAKNFGQHGAMIAGLNFCEGDFVVFLDDDGQCPIDKLKDMIVPLENGWDVTIAEYGKKKQNFLKNIGSKFNEITANIMISKPKDIQMGNFIALKKFVADEMKKYRGPYPYISGLFFRVSGKIMNIPMEERVRLEGKTTYTMRKLISLWLNGFTAFSIKPLRIASLIGVLFSCLGFLYGIIIVITKISIPTVAVGWSSTMAVMLLLGGLILLVLGIIGEYVGRIYMCLSNTPQYVIKKMINVEDQDCVY